MKWMLREFRLVPMVICASAALLVLKTVGLVTGGGYMLSGTFPAQAEHATPAGESEDPYVPDITGSVPAAKPAEKSEAGDKAKPAEVKEGDAKPGEKKPGEKKPGEAKPAGAGKSETSRPMSPAERAILERLQERRKELERRARELDMRENLIKAAEKRLEARINELKQTEARINAALHKKDEAEAARFKGLVTMYENMKPKDAARIFDRLDRRVLIEVATQINPRRMSDILAQMSPEAAERLTVEMAGRSGSGDKTQAAAGNLPKIEGRPVQQ